MSNNYQFDIAISFADEDEHVAKSLSFELSRNKLKYYLYTEHEASQLGESIREIISEVYGAESRYILLITSADYARKYWTKIEREFALLSAGAKRGQIIQLKIDDTYIEGLSNEIVYLEWKLNPVKIAELLYKKIRRKRKCP